MPQSNQAGSFNEFFDKLPSQLKAALMPFAACIADMHKRIQVLEKAKADAESSATTETKGTETA